MKISTYKSIKIIWDEDNDERIYTFINDLSEGEIKNIYGVGECKGTLTIYWKNKNIIPERLKGEYECKDENENEYDYWIIENLWQWDFPKICEKCGSNKNIHEHHIYPQELGGTCEDGVLKLCQKCHTGYLYGIHYYLDRYEYVEKENIIELTNCWMQNKFIPKKKEIVTDLIKKEKYEIKKESKKKYQYMDLVEEAEIEIDEKEKMEDDADKWSRH